MCSVHVTLIFGSMMMVVMRKKVKITLEETSGRRYVKYEQPQLCHGYSDVIWIWLLLYRQQLVLSVPCSLCLCSMVNLKEQEKRSAIILLFQLISSRKEPRNFFYLGFKALEQAPSSSRFGIFLLLMYYFLLTIMLCVAMPIALSGIGNESKATSEIYTYKEVS